MTADVRRAILAHLGRGSDGRFSRSYLVATIRREIDCGETEVYEALWGLVAEGLLYLDPAGQGSGTDNWRWRLSSDGRRAFQGGSWEPRDPEGYLSRLDRAIPNLHPEARMYLTEALRAFNSRCYLASSVMLGVASERAFLEMASHFALSSLPGAAQFDSELSKKRNTYAFLWIQFRKRFEPIREEMPDGLGDLLTLDSVGDLIRVTRNDAGHPSGTVIDEETARAHLTIAPFYLSKMKRLAEHFEQNPK